MTIEPETKNWTWVLERECDECGFDTQSFPPEEIGRLSRLAAEPWPELLAHPLVRAASRRETCWSGLEYGCHVRDVFRLGVYRVERCCTRTTPIRQLGPGRDCQSPSGTTCRIRRPSPSRSLAAADALADVYDTVTPDQWSRPGAAQRRLAVHGRVVRSILPPRPDAPHRRRASRLRRSRWAP